MGRLILDVASGLSHAHREGVLHCDIKPSNILLNRNGAALLTDFNVAMVKNPQEKDQPSLVFGGTLEYMSPEQLSAFEPWLPGEQGKVDVRTDIYSLGVVFMNYFLDASPGDLPLRERVPQPRSILPWQSDYAKCHHFRKNQVDAMLAVEKIPVSRHTSFLP